MQLSIISGKCIPFSQPLILAFWVFFTHHPQWFQSQWILNIQHVQHNGWLTSLSSYNCDLPLGNTHTHTRIPRKLKILKTKTHQSPKIIFLSPSLSMNPNWGNEAICEYLENVQKGSPGYFVLLFCFCENTLWLKAAWREKSLFQLTLLGHGPLLREIGAGSQGGPEAEACLLYCSLAAAQLTFFHSSDSLIREWCCPQCVGPTQVNHQSEYLLTDMAGHSRSDLANSLTEPTSSQVILGEVRLTMKTNQHTR